MGQTGELLQAQLLATDRLCKSALGQHVSQLLFGQLAAVGRGQGVEKGLSPLGEGGPNDGEQLLGGAVHRGSVPQGHADHRRGHLGGGEEALGRHLEEVLAHGVVLAEQGEGPEVGGAGLGADALGYLSLNHHRHPAETAALQQQGDDGGGDVVGQIGAGHGGEPLKLLLYQLGDVQLHYVAGDDLHVVIAAYGLLQNGEQGAVQLH